MAVPSCLRLEAHLALAALALARASAGRSMAAKIAIMAMTTSRLNQGKGPLCRAASPRSSLQKMDSTNVFHTSFHLALASTKITCQILLMAYFCPAGGGGTSMPAVATNSSNLPVSRCRGRVRRNIRVKRSRFDTTWGSVGTMPQLGEGWCAVGCLVASDGQRDSHARDNSEAAQVCQTTGWQFHC